MSSANLSLAKNPVDVQPVTVVFRADKAGDFKGEVTAVFQPEAGDRGVTLYAHVGQHSESKHGMARGWYETTRPATPEESAGLRAELRGIGYDVTESKRMRWV